MNQTPIICPHCGELVLAWVTYPSLLIVPEHPDRITPIEDCLAGSTTLTARNQSAGSTSPWRG